MNDHDLLILGAARTPLGSFQGGLAACPAPILGGVALRGALRRSGLGADAVTDVAMGNVLQAGLGQAPARQAALAAGLPDRVQTTTVHKVCGSGLQAVMQSCHALAAGLGSVALAGGMENMSRAPYLLDGARSGYRLGHQRLIDSVVHDGLWDPHRDAHMGDCAEHCAERYSFTREQQDAYALESFRRAASAQEDGSFAEEIEPVIWSEARGGEKRLAVDEGPARVRPDRITSLRPAFRAVGTITAANASSLNDGAAALVLATASTASRLGVRPLARIAAFGAHAQDPLWFTTAPVEAARRAVAAAGWSVGDVDLWEVNEAFAVVPLAFSRELGLEMARINVFGGAIALGHPIGASGARILVTLLTALRRKGGQRGVAAICIGGGEGLAVAVELL